MSEEVSKSRVIFFASLSKILNVDEEVLHSKDLRELRLYDSIAKLECSALIEQEFGLFIPLDQIEKCTTATDLFNLIVTYKN
jgi:acyl carrier protein